jgi:pyruvate dehydrogenase E2 component (dihydrolipoamide acetyltransferase)
MATPVEVPKLGNTVEECIVARWLKQKGEAVTAGDVVAEIETDKATFEVTAPVSGTLIETYYAEGALAPVFTNLFVIGEVSEKIEPLPTKSGVSTPQPLSPNPASEAPPAPGPRPLAPLFSPRARRFADAHNFHPAAVNGSGPGARVLEEDLRKLYGSGARISSIREKIARRMRESLETTAQYTLHSSAPATGLLAVRARLKATPAHSGVNLNDLITFCVVETLLDLPDLNAEFAAGEIRKHAHVNIGFAVDTARGVVVPVVKNADSLCLDELSARMKELAAQAVEGKIALDDLSGGTFTISNLGALGIEHFTPLLVPPQLAILGVGAIQLRPARRDGQIEFIDTLALSLTCDHQIIDGAPGARFLKALAGKIENIESIC